MKASVVIVLLLGAFYAPCMRGITCPHKGWETGEWSRLAAQPCRENLNQSPVKIPSPDRKQALLVKGDKAFEISRSGGTPEELFVYLPGEEFLWSPDSNNVLITYCLGAMGPCRVDVPGQQGDGSNITQIVRTAFASGHEEDECYTEANVGALTWESDSDKLVVIAEVIPAFACGHNAGHFESFVVSLSQRKVVERFKMQETIQRWRSILGRGPKNDIRFVREDLAVQKK